MANFIGLSIVREIECYVNNDSHKNKKSKK